MHTMQVLGLIALRMSSGSRLPSAAIGYRGPLYSPLSQSIKGGYGIMLHAGANNMVTGMQQSFAIFNESVTFAVKAICSQSFILNKRDNASRASSSIDPAVRLPYGFPPGFK